MPIANNIDNKITEKEYLKGERVSDIKYEFIDGDVFAMAGASQKHNRISSNFVREIDSKLKQ
jgi:Uma2 family endonuclease